MSDAPSFAGSETDRLDSIISDIRSILDEERIDPGEIEDLNLESEEVSNFLKDLRNDAEPEYSLRDELLAGRAILGRFLFGEKMPETPITKPDDDESVGKIDYQLRDHPILVELKPLYGKYKKGDGIEYLRQTDLDWKDHQEQIERYVKGEYEYLVFTNLKDWYFFSSRHNGPINDEPLSFDEFLDQLEANHNHLPTFLERFDKQSQKGELDEKFFKSLENWVSALEDVEFKDDVKPSQKTEKIINFVNKFIFIRTLDDYGVIDLSWIEKEWESTEDSWSTVGDDVVLEEFLSKVNRWFYSHYDTDLFPPRETLLDYVKEDEDNLNKFYRRVKFVLGVEDWQTADQNKGITGYRYQDIDEDIFGKAYETFLAEKRNEEGIYYTPRYITRDIVETRVGPKFDEHIEEFEESLEAGDLEAARDALIEMSQVKVVDPACGSGSFLIKTIRLIWEKYSTVSTRLDEARSELMSGKDELDWGELNLDFIGDMQEIVRGDQNRERINQIVVRHIHGNDIDTNALSVAKVNIWKEAIKLTPSDFHYERIPDGTGHTLPELQMNFGMGDALLGFPDDEAVNVLGDDYSDVLQQLFDLRDAYLSNPEDEAVVQEIEELKQDLNDDLYDDFKEYLKKEDYGMDVLNESTPLHWPADFWYVYFDPSLSPLEDPGFDVVIGNPPYERIQTMRENKPEYVEYLNARKSYTTTFGNYDIAIPFIERGYQLLAEGGNFGYIVTKKWMTSDYGEKLRELLSKDCAVSELIDFGSEQVFDDPSTYTAILSLTNKPQEKFRYAQVTNLTKEPEQLKRIHESDSQRVDSDLYVTIEECEDLDEDYWAFGTADEEKIFDKLEDYPTLQEKSKSIFVGLQTSADPVYIVEVIEDRSDQLKVYSKHKDDEYVIEKEITKPILKGAEIERWAIRGYDYVLIFPYTISDDSADLISESDMKKKYRRTWDYLTDCKKKLKDERSAVNEDTWWEFPYKKNLEDFDQPKIITQVNANYASFALDEPGIYYFVGGGTAGGYGVSFEEDEEALRKRILGLLNSYLLDWLVKHESSEFQGEFFSFAKRYMVDLPIAEPDDEDEFNDLVMTLVELATAKYKIEEFWVKEKSLATQTESLTSLLSTDQQSRRYGSFGDGRDPWFSDVEFYPDDDAEILEKEYGSFKVEGDSSSNELQVYGVHGESEDRIYSLEFPSTQHLSIVYLSIKELFDTKKKVETLQNLLDKTEIPVITPNSALNTPRIMDEVEADFDGWRTDASISTSVEADVVALENREEERFIQLNKDVFEMYDLDRDEAMTIMNKTKVRHRERDRILNIL